MDATQPSGVVWPALPGGYEDGFDDLPEAWLRSRPGIKWAQAGPSSIPAWVADMDFPAPAVARRALEHLAGVADLGYDFTGPARLEKAWLDRMGARFGWAPRPGVVRAFDNLVQAVEAVLHVSTSPGEGVLLMTPSYPVFVEVLEEMGRPLLSVPVAPPTPGAPWEPDLQVARDLAPQARALLLANPHNPTGRVLSRSQLGQLALIAEDNDLLVISDEVHAELLLADEASHVPFASLSPEAAGRTVTLYSASKSFNLGGMGCAVAHLGAERVAERLSRLPGHLLGTPGIAAVATTLACWSPEGDSWLDRCLARLRANRAMVGDWLAGDGGAAGVKGALPDATYLQWLDFRATGLGGDPAGALNDAGVIINPGPSFGPGGDGFGRLNFATTPAILGEMLDRISRRSGA